jgi:RNA polymerase sigma factor (sigma-70 family)
VSLRPFDEIVSEHGPVVYRVCRALVGPEDAQDAWSETFLSALRAYPELAPDSNVRGWLITIAHRRTIDQLRAAQRRPRPAGIAALRLTVGEDTR